MRTGAVQSSCPSSRWPSRTDRAFALVNTAIASASRSAPSAVEAPSRRWRCACRFPLVPAGNRAATSPAAIARRTHMRPARSVGRARHTGIRLWGVRTARSVVRGGGESLARQPTTGEAAGRDGRAGSERAAAAAGPGTLPGRQPGPSGARPGFVPRGPSSWVWGSSRREVAAAAAAGRAVSLAA